MIHSVRVETFWDLGVGDSTSIWFVQQVGRAVHVIDYYENRGEGLPHYAKVLQQKEYLYSMHHAPHDIEVRELSTGKSRREAAYDLGINFRVVPKLPLEDGIHAAKMLLLVAGLMQSCASLVLRLSGSITALITSVCVVLGTHLYMIGVRIARMPIGIWRWVLGLCRTVYVQLKGMLTAVIIRLQRRR